MRSMGTCIAIGSLWLKNFKIIWNRWHKDCSFCMPPPLRLAFLHCKCIHPEFHIEQARSLELQLQRFLSLSIVVVQWLQSLAADPKGAGSLSAVAVTFWWRWNAGGLCNMRFQCVVKSAKSFKFLELFTTVSLIIMVWFLHMKPDILLSSFSLSGKTVQVSFVASNQPWSVSCLGIALPSTRS